MSTPPTPYDVLGGAEMFRRLVARFYEGVAGDPVLRPLYPEDELDAADVLEVDACVVVWLASAGSWPETSWMTIPPVVVKKRAVAAPTTRRRMRLTRSRRFCRGVEDMGTAWAP